MEVRLDKCPVGATCERAEIENGKPIIYRCPWYTEVRGTNPNTGVEESSWNCAIAWMPALLINAANEARKGAAATESFRNEVVRGVPQPSTKQLEEK